MIEHISDKHFKMIRYYGFLSNRKRGTLLPKVYAALDIVLGPAPEMPGYAAMLKGYAKLDPYACVVCGSQMEFARFRSGESLSSLMKHTIVQSQISSACAS